MGTPIPRDNDITILLQQWRNGDREAGDRLMPIVYHQLKRIAARHLARESRGNPLQATALVHEAYLKLVTQRAGWQSRAHFFAIAAQVMRRIVIDHARRRGSLKRGGGADVTLSDLAGPEPALQQVDVLALDTALAELERLDPMQGRLVELRFFGGLTIEETAEVLGVSAAMVKREWAIARGWLWRSLTAGPNSGDEG